MAVFKTQRVKTRRSSFANTGVHRQLEFIGKELGLPVSWLSLRCAWHVTQGPQIVISTPLRSRREQSKRLMVSSVLFRSLERTTG